MKQVLRRNNHTFKKNNFQMSNCCNKLMSNSTMTNSNWMNPFQKTLSPGYTRTSRLTQDEGT